MNSLETTTFDVTLNKLQRCLETIKASLNSEQSYNVLDFPYNSSELIVNDALKMRANEQIELGRKKAADYLQLYNDLYTLESSLFCGNAESGMSSILSQLKYLKEMKTKITSLNTQFKSYSSYTTCTKDNLSDKLDLLTQNARLKKASPQWDGSIDAPRIYLFTYDTTEYEKMMVDLTKKISELENKRDKLNATFTVTVALSDKSKQLLGL